MSVPLKITIQQLPYNSWLGFVKQDITGNMYSFNVRQHCSTFWGMSLQTYGRLNANLFQISTKKKDTYWT